MHKNLWLSVLLTLFLSVSGCAKHEDAHSESTKSTGSISTQPAASASAPTQTPVKDEAANRSDTPKPEAEKPKILRKKEVGNAEDKAKPSGDDMERMD